MSRVEQVHTHAVIATDVVIFTILAGVLKVLLIAMKKHPYEKHWALPGGLVGGGEGLEDAAFRHLFDKTGVREVYLEQLATFGEPKRDPFGRVVSVAYMALLSASDLRLKTTNDYAGVAWFPVSKVPSLAYDHKVILHTAHERLKGKLAYTNIAYGLLPKEFTLSELQSTYEIILGHALDKRNFRKKLLALNLVASTKKHRREGAHRPAELYRFTRRIPTMVEVL
jgi:8-oxo-dGTP diphosphatase